MALKKLCPWCNSVIDYSNKYCPECAVKADEQKKDRVKYYDKHIRTNVDFYNSKRWRDLTVLCSKKFHGVDVYAYYSTGEIVSGSLSHHVRDVDSYPEGKYSLDNLIYTSDASHKEIHTIYDKDGKSKRDTQELLVYYVNKWEEEFGR